MSKPMLLPGTNRVANAKVYVECGASSLKEMIHFKHCPNSEALQQNLHSRTSFHGEVQDTDWLCHHCWKRQSAILEKIDSKDEIVIKDDLKVLTDQIATTLLHDDITGSTTNPELVENLFISKKSHVLGR